MFTEVHSEQEEGWRLEGAVIATQTNPLLMQREQGPMTIPCNSIDATTKAQQCVCGNNRYRGIISHLAQADANKEGGTVPFINNLEIIEVFKDEDEEEGVSVTDFIK